MNLLILSTDILLDLFILMTFFYRYMGKPKPDINKFIYYLSFIAVEAVLTFNMLLPAASNSK